MVQKFVTEEMTIGEIVEKYPQVAQVIQSYGLHCIGCHVNPYESLKQGALGHGMPQDVFEQMMQDVNKTIEETKNSPQTSQELKLHESHEQNEGITLTEAAVGKLLDFREKDGKGTDFGLRVMASPGGCAGFMYRLEFDKPNESDVTFDNGKINVIVQKNQLEMLSGVVIDYLDGLEGSGFKISNPNATGSCGCGKSFH